MCARALLLFRTSPSLVPGTSGKGCVGEASGAPMPMHLALTHTPVLPDRGFGLFLDKDCRGLLQGILAPEEHLFDFPFYPSER